MASAPSCRCQCFFSYWYGAHPDLHSFPTRRSSDLSAAGSWARAQSCSRLSDEPLICRRVRSRAACGCRSEEHTSELQSLRHLVCRLLLEKKKITSNHRVVRT